jgi:hypothetical protein
VDTLARTRATSARPIPSTMARVPRSAPAAAPGVSVSSAARAAPRASPKRYAVPVTSLASSTAPAKGLVRTRPSIAREMGRVTWRAPGWRRARGRCCTAVAGPARGAAPDPIRALARSIVRIRAIAPTAAAEPRVRPRLSRYFDGCGSAPHSSGGPPCLTDHGGFHEPRD